MLIVVNFESGTFKWIMLKWYEHLSHVILPHLKHAYLSFLVSTQFEVLTTFQWNLLTIFAFRTFHSQHNLFSCFCLKHFKIECYSSV
jgi:hypothetical protein